MAGPRDGESQPSSHSNSDRSSMDTSHTYYFDNPMETKLVIHNFQECGNIVFNVRSDLKFNTLTSDRYKDGDELEEGPKYHMTFSDNYASLFVNGLDPEDAGKYRCKAVNDLGEDTTTAKLAVEGKISLL